MTIEAQEEFVDLEKTVTTEEVIKESKKEKKEGQEKSNDELIAMNDAAQKQISRQGNEIGELRRLTDEILRKQLDSATTKDKEPADWDYNPKEAAEELVNSKVDAIEAKLEEGNRQRALETFANKHPDYTQTAQSEDFREWVMQSPMRVRMYEAGNAGDFDVADELFTEWNGANKQEKPDTTDDGTKQALKDAKMEKGNGSPATKKIYRRAELRNLRLTNPSAYEARQEEFHLAYQEGRVR